MVHNRHQPIAGTSMFFTHMLHDRHSHLLCEHIDLFRNAYAAVCSHWPFVTRAAVILPEHLHCIWQLPAHDTDYSGRWRLIKARFTTALRWRGVRIGLHGEGRSGAWQRGSWEHLLRNDDDVRAHIDYIHINPLKHGLVQRVRDWPHSSFHRHAAQGHVSPDWGDAVPEPNGRFGE